MIKKNSWIVALILALSLTVFFGCVDGYVPVADEDDYTEFELKEFNTKGGQVYQQGWANDNTAWGDPEHTAQAIGLDLETLQKAKYLKFELNAEPLAGAMDVILGGDSKGWVQNASTVRAGATGTVEINLTLLNGYSDFIGAKEKARIIIQYNQAGQGNAGVVKNPRLLISDKAAEIPTDEVYEGTAAVLGTGADAGKVIHNNPGFSAPPGTKISENGTITMDGAAVFYYKFPAKTSTFDIAEYDYFVITYDLSNVVKTSGGAGDFKARINKADNTSGYDYVNGGYWLNLGPAGNNQTTDDLTVALSSGGKDLGLQTWGAGDTGGFALILNTYDTATSGCDSVDLKVTKIVFSKEAGGRHTVKFFDPLGSKIVYPALTVMHGNTLGTRFPASPKSPGMIFRGWYNKQVAATGNADTSGTKITSGDAITDSHNLFAHWEFGVLEDAVEEGSALSLIYVGDAATASKRITVGGKEYVYIFNAMGSDPLTGMTPTEMNGYTPVTTSRYGVQFKEDFSGYGKIVVTYDTIRVTNGTDCGSNCGVDKCVNTIRRKNLGTGYDSKGDWGYPDLEVGEGKKITLSESDIGTLASDSDGITFTKNHSGSGILIRITKVEYFVEG